MSKQKSKAPMGDFDLVAPLLEAFEEILKMLTSLIWHLIKALFRKITNQEAPIKKIERSSLNKKKTTSNSDSLGVDLTTKKDLKLNQLNFKKHTFIVGASGFGKTNLITLLQENALKNNKPVIFFDPKGDLEALEGFKDLCAKYRRPCHIFSEHYDQSIKLNPVKDGTVNQISERIMNSFTWSEPYYRNCSEQSLILVLKKLKNDDEIITLEKIVNELKTIETKDNLGLIVKLEKLMVSDFAKILNDDKGKTLLDIREERACLYIGLSVQGYGETARSLGRIFLGELLYNSYKSLVGNSRYSVSKSNPISVYYDEFGAIVTKEFIELQNKCRSAGIELTVAVQTMADIDQLDKSLTRQIIENSNNIFVLKQRDPDSAEHFSNRIGTILGKKQTYKVENGEKQSMASERETLEMIVHPDIIKNLKVGQCVFLSQEPKFVKLLNLRFIDQIIDEQKEDKISKNDVVGV